MKRVHALLMLVARLLLVFMLWQIVIRFLRKRYHFPAPAIIGRFLDSRTRRLLQPPERIIERSGIGPGMTVLEIGCGSGAFTTFVARAVGETGVVHALDIQPAMLEQLRRKLERPEYRDIQNIRLHEGSAYELPFEDESIDLVYMVAVLQEIPDTARVLFEARRVLKPGGILAISEFLPDPDFPLPATTEWLGREAGFLHETTLGNLWSYTVRFRKPEKIGRIAR